MKKFYLMLAILVQVSLANSQHFVPGFIGAGDNHFSINMVGADIGGVPLETGDEIAAFDGNLCVGVLVLTQTIVPGDENTYQTISASADDGNVNGYTPGNKVYLRFWDSSAGVEYHNVNLTVTDKDGNPIANAYVLSGTAYVTATTAANTLTWVGGNLAGGAQNWGNINNWNPKVIPEPLHNVVIPNVIAARMPIIFPGITASAGSLSIANTVTLGIVSDDTGDGSLVIANGYTGTPTVYTQRFMSPSAWHLVSTSVSGGTIADFLSLNVAVPTNGSSRGMMNYDENNDDWNSYFTDASAGSINSGEGYCVRIDDQGDPTMNNVMFMGSLTYGSLSIPVTKSNFGWNLIGNPYPSAIYAKQEVHGFLAVNDAVLDPSYKAIYLWDQVANAYEIINSGEGQNNLASGQGFFVKAAAAGNVTFKQTMQVHETNAAFKSAVIPAPKVVLKAQAGNIYASTKVNFNKEMTLGLDPSYDAGILKSGNGLDIYSKLVNDNGVDFAIQWLPGNSGDSYVIPIGVDAVNGGEVVFSAESLNLPVGYEVMIEDRLTSTFTDLMNGESYATEIAANSQGTGRFYLHVGSSLQTGIAEIQKDEISVYTVGQNLYIKGNVDKDAQFMVYSIEGRLINRFGATSQILNQISISGFTPGIYFVKVQDMNKYKPVKFVIGN